MARYSGRFCCARGEPNPNDAYYDMLHDVIPHTDKFGRVINFAWKPLNGMMTKYDVDKMFAELVG